MKNKDNIIRGINDPSLLGIRPDADPLIDDVQEPAGAPFYCLDGPLKGTIIHGDFREYKAENTVYRKVTFAGIINKHRVFCDVAYCGELPERLPRESILNAVIEPLNKPPTVSEILGFLEPVGLSGTLKSIETSQ